MTRRPKISIIVPIHNAGSYLHKCLESLVVQTLQDIEIILVLDNPTDGSDKVAKSFVEKDERIKLINNETNLHTGLSRNRGIDAAIGEYIGFQDHDDYCEPEMYEKLYNKAKEKDLDIVRCNFTCIVINNGAEEKSEYNYPESSNSISDKSWLYEKVSSDTVSCVIWNHIYKSDFIRKYDLRFLDSRSICSEDSVFFLKAYHNVQKFDTIPDYLYHHVFHTSNTGKMYGYRSMKNRIAFLENIYTSLIEYNVEDSLAISYLSRNTLRSLYSGSRQALKLFPLKKALKEIQAIGSSNVVLKCINYMYRKDNSNKLLQLKPTIVIFFSIIKVIYSKRAK